MLFPIQRDVYCLDMGALMQSTFYVSFAKCVNIAKDFVDFLKRFACIPLDNNLITPSLKPTLTSCLGVCKHEYECAKRICENEKDLTTC